MSTETKLTEELSKYCPSQEPEYVVVSEKEEESSERIELPTAQDNTLGLQTLTRAFPNAHGLKFKNPSTKAYRALLIDSSGTKFFPPSGGWKDKSFIVIYQQTQPSKNVEVVKKVVVKSDQNAKRRKIARDSDDDGKFDSSDSEKGDKRQRQSGGAFKQKRVEWNEDEEDEPYAKCSDLIVLGLPFRLDDSEVEQYFEQFGKVSLVEIKKQSTGTSKGFGFVRMETFDGQLKILNKPTHVIGGRKCQVRVPLDKNGEARDNPLASAKMFVGRIQEKTTTADLKQFFSEEAKKIDPETEVLDVYIPKPFRAFAFVTLSNPLVVKKLIKRTDFVIDEASVSVSSAMPKNPSLNNSQGQMSNPSSQFNRVNGMNNSFPEPERFNDWFESTGRYNNREASYPQTSRNRITGQGFVGNNYPMGGNPSVSGAGSQMLATGLETLNLNNMKPELVNAWKAFISVAQSNGAMSPTQHSSSPPHYNTGQGYPPQMHSNMSRRNGGGSHGGPNQWRM
uniref:RRM domain-containing protein n=1 Tax=Ditylenchus dipsaci TaxID=166011 RepID=A0A915DLD2_9BILA